MYHYRVTYHNYFMDGYTSISIVFMNTDEPYSTDLSDISDKIPTALIELYAYSRVESVEFLGQTYEHQTFFTRPNISVNDYSIPSVRYLDIPGLSTEATGVKS